MNSFCLTFEWEDVVYNTGNGTECPEVDAGATILKVRLNPVTSADVAITTIVYGTFDVVSSPRAYCSLETGIAGVRGFSAFKWPLTRGEDC